MNSRLAPGSIFAGYRIDGIVGRGGMGVVYRAWDVALERPVALKVVAPELAEDARFRERFLREARLAASLEHTHVLPVYAAGEHEGQLYLAMRFVEGEDLRALLEREGRLSPDEAVRVVAEVGAALDAAHAKGLVHRDVKPGNVLLGPAGESYLCDFGLSKPTTAEKNLTESGQFLGTLDYVAPEQIRGQEVDGRADQYALGCVLFECLAGRPPFEQGSGFAVLLAHMEDPPASLSASRPECAAFDPIIERALAKEPSQRYPSCDDFGAAARSVLEDEQPTPARRRKRRTTLLLALGGVLAAGAVAVAVVFGLGSGGSGAVAPPAAEGAPAGQHPVTVEPNSVAAIDPETNAVVDSIEVGTAPTSIAVGEGAVWVLNGDDRTVSRIDLQTRTERTVSVGGTPTDIAVGEGAVWVANGYDGTVTRVDPQTSLVERTITLRDPGESPAARPGSTDEDRLRSYVAVGDGSVWVADGRSEGVVWRIDAGTNAVVATISLGPNMSGGAVAFGEGAAWVAGYPGVLRIDPRTNEVAETIPLVGLYAEEIAAGEGGVWVPGTWTSQATRERCGVSTRHGTSLEKTITVGREPIGVAVGNGSVWVASGLGGTVSRVDSQHQRCDRDDRARQVRRAASLWARASYG